MPNKLINVLFVEAPPELYGSSRSLQTLIMNLDRSEIRPVLACNEHNELLNWANLNGIRSYPLSLPGLPPEVPGKRRMSYAVSNAPFEPGLSEWLFLPVREFRDRLKFRGVRDELSKIMSTEKIDILHLNNQVSSNRFAYNIDGSVEIVQHVRDAPLSRSLHASKLASRANRIIAISRYVRDEATVAYNRSISDVVFNPLDREFRYSQRKRNDWRTRWRIEEDKLVFGQAGRFVDWKGVDTAIKAYTKLCADTSFMETTRLVLVGAPADETDYLAQCKCLAEGLPSGQVRIEPFSDDVMGIFSAFDVTLHPIKKPEAFGRVIIESMACRAVPIARNLGAIKELIKHKQNGLLIDDFEELCEGMLELWRDRDAVRKLAECGASSLDVFDASFVARQVENIYREVLYI
ncbi:glycosyltransferase family 4 protein [Marimonas sp. MJW-29]|uniref:Glycosyltransferase family 4 protein n=1 Tax=Sulfitobacter sediminis TaxID=3234186 RepID=A0ABV3RN59_9RHOB